MDKNKLFLGFVTAALGLFLLLSPEAFVKFFVIILGIAAIIDGVFILAATRNLILDPQYNKIVTVRGVLSIIVGLLAVFLPMLVAAVIWKMMAYTLAVYLFISAGLEAFTISKLHRNGIMIRQSLIEVLCSVIIAVVLLIIPSESAGNFIIRLMGLVLLVFGVGFVLLQWKNRPVIVEPESVETVENESEENQESDKEDE